MALEDIRDRIVQQAGNDAQKLIADAKAEAAGIISQAKAQAKQEKKAFIEELNVRNEQMLARQRAGAELEASKLVLGAKKELIEDVFAAAKKELEALDDKTRALHVSSLLEKAKKELNIAKVLCSKQDIQHVKGFKAQASPMLGGIIAEDKNGDVRLDLRYETILDTLRDKTLKEVAETLFGK
jgi:V/A-type H+/Na+-transporting ATPase subunit E